jgi:CheY-like chemotaxis protein
MNINGINNGIKGGKPITPKATATAASHVPSQERKYRIWHANFPVNRQPLKSDFSKIDIAIIDDDEMLLDLMSSLLKKSGFRKVHTFQDSGTLYKFLEQDETKGKISGGELIVITDYKMPERNGMQVAGDIKGMVDSSSIPFLPPLVIYSGKMNLSDVQKTAENVGFVAGLFKPFQLKDLQEFFTELLSVWNTR